MACQNALTLRNSTGGYVWWDFVNNPTGTNPSQWVMNFGDHVVSTRQLPRGLRLLTGPAP